MKGFFSWTYYHHRFFWRIASLHIWNSKIRKITSMLFPLLGSLITKIKCKRPQYLPETQRWILKMLSLFCLPRAVFIKREFGLYLMFGLDSWMIEEIYVLDFDVYEVWGLKHVLMGAVFLRVVCVGLGQMLWVFCYISHNLLENVEWIWSFLLDRAFAIGLDRAIQLIFWADVNWIWLNGIDDILNDWFFGY